MSTTLTGVDVLIITRATRFEDLPDVLTPAEAATWLGIKLAHVYAMGRSGDIPVRRYGRVIRIDKHVIAPRGK